MSAALGFFWTNGYESTSIESISAATGVGNGSIYAAYGSKRNLFEQVLTAYCGTRVDIVRDAMSEGDTARDSIRRFFDVIVDDCATQPERRGCLMLNTIAEWGGRDAAILELCQRTTRDMEAAVAQRLVAEKPDVASAEVAVLAAQIIMVSQGLIAMSRLDVSRERMAAIADVYCRSLAA
ncbi:TetR/AcrR family transcriptional regulator [soil metagenome]